MHNHFRHPLGAFLSIMLAAIPAALAQPSAPPTAKAELSTGQILTTYQHFTVQPIAPWPAANQTVEKIGGWRTYARETAEPITPPKPTSSSPPASEPKP